VVTTEWINIEEIVGSTSVEINLEESFELEINKKIKEGNGNDLHSYFFNIPINFHLEEIENHQFLFQNTLTDNIPSVISEIPLFILFRQIKVFS
jgi:hypothetical protein